MSPHSRPKFGQAAITVHPARSCTLSFYSRTQILTCRGLEAANPTSCPRHGDLKSGLVKMKTCVIGARKMISLIESFNRFVINEVIFLLNDTDTCGTVPAKCEYQYTAQAPSYMRALKLKAIHRGMTQALPHFH